METGNGTNIISLVCKVFSSRANSLTDGGIVQGISSIQQHEPDVFAPPVTVPLSESLARSLIPMESYCQYTELERLFVQLATTRDWTSSETQKVFVGDVSESGNCKTSHKTPTQGPFCNS